MANCFHSLQYHMRTDLAEIGKKKDLLTPNQKNIIFIFYFFIFIFYSFVFFLVWATACSFYSSPLGVRHLLFFASWKRDSPTKSLQGCQPPLNIGNHFPFSESEFPIELTRGKFCLVYSEKNFCNETVQL